MDAACYSELGAKNFAFAGHFGDLYFVLMYHLIRAIKAVFAIDFTWLLIPENYLYNNFLYHILMIWNTTNIYKNKLTKNIIYKIQFYIFYHCFPKLGIFLFFSLYYI
jgi:hypothetical protein